MLSFFLYLEQNTIKSYQNLLKLLGKFWFCVNYIYSQILSHKFGVKSIGFKFEEINFKMHIKSCIVICFLCFTTVLSSEISCTFEDLKFYAWKTVYSCKTKGFKFESDNKSIMNITGVHENDLSNTNVQGLNIDHADCNYFPTNVKDFFPNLELLQISFSKLNYIVEGNFMGLSELKFVRINSNVQIFNLPENTFKGAENIQDLKMYSNYIRKVHENAFRGLKNLENLELSKNLLSVIELNTFKDLISLKTLHLSENYIVELSSELFKTNSLLQKLFIRSNKLTTLHADLFLPLIYLKEANFDGNVCIDEDSPADLSIEDLKTEINENCTGLQKIKMISQNIEQKANENHDGLKEQFQIFKNEIKVFFNKTFISELSKKDNITDVLIGMQDALKPVMIHINDTISKNQENVQTISDKSSENWTLVRNMFLILILIIVVIVVTVVSFIAYNRIKTKKILRCRAQNFPMSEDLVD